MKGFLNKVQRRVSGSGPSGGEGDVEPVAPPGSPSSSAKTAAAAPSGRVGDGVPLAQVEVVPKADVTLPRKERRLDDMYLHIFKPHLMTFLLS
jgi:hypothetical protein